MTGKLEEIALDYIDRIDKMGGMVEAIEAGYPQKEIQESAYWYQKAVEKKEKIMVGYKTPDGVEWYSDKEALTVWEILMQNKTAVDAKLWEYHCEDLAF